MLKKISLVTAGNMFNAFLGFIYLWAVANTLPLDQFGKYSLFVSLLVVTGRLTDFGTNSTFVTNSILKKTEESTFFYTKLLLTIVAIVLGILALFLLNLASPLITMLFVGGIIAYSLNYTLYALYQKEEAYTYLVLLYTIPAFIKAIFAPLFFLQIIEPTLEVAAGVFGLSIFTGLILLLENNPLKNLNLSKGTLKLLKASWPAGISQTINEVWSALSNTIAKIISGFADVGVFALANKVSVVFSLLSLSIFAVLLPSNAKRKKQELKYSFDEAALLAMLTLVIGVIGIISSRIIITNFFGPKFEASLDLLNILVFASALASIATFMENYFFIEEDTKKILTINLSKLGAFLVSIFILTPDLKLKGVAYSQLIAAVISVIITAIFIFLPEKTNKLNNLKARHLE